MRRLILSLAFALTFALVLLKPSQGVICNPDYPIPQLVEEIGMDAGSVVIVDYNLIDPDGKYDGQKLTVAKLSGPDFVVLTMPGIKAAPEPNSVDCDGVPVIAADSNGIVARFTCSPSKAQTGTYLTTWEVNDGSGAANSKARYSFSLTVTRKNQGPFLYGPGVVVRK